MNTIHGTGPIVTRYFRAAGRSLAAGEAFLADFNAAVDQARALEAEIGASESWHTDRVTAFGFSDEPPASPPFLAAPDIDPRAWVPNRRTREGKALHMRMLAIRFPRRMTLCTRMGLPVLTVPAGGGQMLLHTIGMRQLGGAWVFEVDCTADAERVPPDAIPMRASEFWALVEAEDDAERARSAQNEATL